MTSTELAAWVQAIGSMFAIFAAVMVAVWLSKRTFDNALKLQREERKQSRVELAKTLAVLSRNCAKAVNSYIDQLPDSGAIFDIAEERVYFDIQELRTIERAVGNIPLHELPSALVTHIMILSATVRQFREKIELALRLYRKMDATAFDDLFSTFQEMKSSLELTCKDIDNEIQRLSEEIEAG